MIDSFVKTLFKPIYDKNHNLSIDISIKNLLISIGQKQNPPQSEIAKIRNRVDNVKFRFENAIRRKFNGWQKRVLFSFLSQMEDGASILVVEKELKQELEKILVNHWQRVAETFAPRTSFERIKAVTVNPIDAPAESETENINDEIFLLGILSGIENNIQNSINKQKLFHTGKILDTTKTIGNSGKSLSKGNLREAKAYIANKFAARTTTVAVTETQWIAETAQNIALEFTTPVAAYAGQNQLKLLQSVSPNVRLINEDIDKLFAEGTQNEINTFRQNISNPQKMWITMGDKRVRRSHSEVNGTIIGINQAFSLRGGLLLFPTDTSLGASFSEIAGCRCHLIYF